MTEKKKNGTIGLNVTVEVFDLLKKIAEAADRPLGYVARELMLRGLARYKADGQLRQQSTDFH